MAGAKHLVESDVKPWAGSDVKVLNIMFGYTSW